MITDACQRTAALGAVLGALLADSMLTAAATAGPASSSATAPSLHRDVADLVSAGVPGLVPNGEQITVRRVLVLFVTSLRFQGSS